LIESGPGARRRGLRRRCTRTSTGSARCWRQRQPVRRPVRLARRSGGYVLEVDPEDVDLHRFLQLALAARDRQRPDDERARLLRAALDLWRG